MQVTAAKRERAILGQLSDMDLRLLRIFKVVADCAGMAAAELELNISTSTISRHIKDLETRLGLVLCRRGRAGFALTMEGQRVYEEMMKLLAAVDGFRGSIDDIHHRMGGELNLAVFDKTVSNPSCHLAKAIARLAEHAPDVAINLHVSSINEIERSVIDGTVHLGIIPSHRNSRSLAYRELFGETMVLYCGRTHPLYGAMDRAITWKQLRDHEFAGLGYHSPNMEASHRARLVRKATGFDQEAIATFILSGRYLGFLPTHYADGLEHLGLLKPVSAKRFRYDCKFVSVVRKSPQPTRATRLFQQLLQDVHQLGS